MAIRAQPGAALGLPLDRVSVKFKTAEKMGLWVRGDRLKAQAMVTVKRD